LVGRFQLDIKGTGPRVTLVQRAERIQVGHLLADLPWDDRLSGRGEITADLISTGHSADALRRSLVGTLTIRFPQGAVRGFSLERLIREARARLRGETPPKDLPMDTEFTDLRASAEVQNGVLRNWDLVATTEHLRITGAGTLDLVQGHVDYRFEPRFVEPPKDLSIKELEGIPIPVHLTGPFDHPCLGPGSGECAEYGGQTQAGREGRRASPGSERARRNQGVGTGPEGFIRALISAFVILVA